jgi:hypothetical protein
MKSNAKHNKIKNTGILFELLVRQVTADVMENKQNGVAVKLMQEFFSPKTELGKELMLYRAFFNVHNLSEQKAFQFLNLVTQQHKTLNQKKLQTEKYNLIREIKHNFDLKEFFSTRVPSYKVYASVYKIFENLTTNNIALIQEVAASQFTIVEFLSGKTANKHIKEDVNLSTAIRQQDNSVRFLSYKILLERFNAKYKGLSEPQKKLLQEYIYNTSNPTKLKAYMQTESKTLVRSLQLYSRKISDNVTKIKLAEVVTQLKRIHAAPAVKENHMTALLIGYEILKELKSL